MNPAEKCAHDIIKRAVEKIEVDAPEIKAAFCECCENLYSRTPNQPADRCQHCNKAPAIV